MHPEAPRQLPYAQLLALVGFANLLVQAHLRPLWHPPTVEAAEADLVDPQVGPNQMRAGAAQVGPNQMSTLNAMLNQKQPIQHLQKRYSETFGCLLSSERK